MSIIWPNGGTTAFAFGFDLDGDTIWENKTRRLPNGDRYIKGRSIGLYGPNKGALRVLEILDEFNMKATWFIPADIVEEHAGLVNLILKAGHEIAHHGWDHREDYGATFEEQMAYLEGCQQIFERNTGVRAVGFRPCGPLLPRTEEWLYTKGGGIYNSSDLIGDDCAYYTVNGTKTRAVTIPCRAEMDDYILTVFNSYPPVLAGMPRIAPYTHTLRNFIREVEGAVRFGNTVSTAFHPQVAGSPGRALMLRNFCEYLASNPRVWVATCEEIAMHYRATVEG